MPIFLKMIAVVILGAVGALVFNMFLSPYFLASAYFENFQFIKDFKEGKIVVNQEKQVYIQQNTAIQDAIERAQKSVVAVHAGSVVVSGLVVSSDGLVVTLAKGIPASGNTNVFLGQEQVIGRVVKIDSKNNLALLKIEKNNLATVPFAGRDSIKLGQAVFLVGLSSAAKDAWFANEGIIAEITSSAVKTNISERPAAAGSPLLNAAGELVGINLIDQAGKVSAIPVSKIQELLGL